MELAPTGTLNVDGNLTMTPQAEYIFQLERVANGMTAVAGNADLAGTLIVQATSGLEAVGDSLRPIMIAGAITDTFDVEPAVGEHLGYGVFHWGVWYNFGTGVVRPGRQRRPPVHPGGRLLQQRSGFRLDPGRLRRGHGRRQRRPTVDPGERLLRHRAVCGRHPRAIGPHPGALWPARAGVLQAVAETVTHLALLL